MLDNLTKDIKRSFSGGKLNYIQDIKHASIKNSDRELVSEVIKTLSDKYFALQLLSDLENSSTLVLSNNEKTEYHIVASRMLSSRTNMLIGRVKDIFFFICQHVTSCDYIYFPKYRLYCKNAHSNPLLMEKDLRVLLNKLTPDIDLSPKKVTAIIVSHARPYHFFYDVAIMLEVLYKKDLLKNLKVYQIEGGNFLDPNQIYDLHCDTKVMTFEELNKESQNRVLFKVGSNFTKFKEDFKRASEALDTRLVNTLSNQSKDDSCYVRAKQLKEKGYFILWISVATEKRSLENQVDLAVTTINTLSLYHNICVIVDGWTAINGVSGEQDYRNIALDSEVLDKIKKECSDSEFVSLIGATSEEKISVANLTDFHVTSGATGSMWPSRFAKKKGLMHSSLGFRSVCENSHLHYNSLFFPLDLIRDADDRLDTNYLSYAIDVDRAVEYMLMKFPVLTTEYYDYSRLELKNTDGLTYIDQIRGVLGKNQIKSRIYLNVDSLKNIVRPYILSLIGFISLSQEGDCHILLDFGGGYNESDKYVVTINKITKSFQLTVKIDRPVLGIRLDPVFDETEFGFNELFYKTKILN